jgi:hypothetical protein
MFPADDVVELVRKTGVLFADQTIFAAVARPASNFGSERLREITGHERGFDEPLL